jgi:para-nitrobenzyl esterase
LGEQLGACHGLELPFVSNSLDNPLAHFLLGDASAPLQALSNRIHAAWAMFIRTGNPNTPAFPDWPPYDLTQRTTMLLNDVSQIVDDPQADVLPLWYTVS